MLNPRALAATILLPVLQQKSSLSHLSDKLYLLQEGQDRALVQELCFGVCRWFYQLDAIAHKLLRKPMGKKDQDVYALILVGLYQVLHMHKPIYASVSETVEAVKTLKKPWAKGLVNAVLRNYERKHEAILAEINQKNVAQFAHPEWILAALKEAWPNQWQSIVAANNDYPSMILRVNLNKNSRDDYLTKLAENDIEASAGEYAPSSIWLSDRVDVASLPGFADGDVSVQDEAAQLAAGLLQLKPGLRVLDACAAPGGKAAHILELEPKLAELFVADESDNRLQFLSQDFLRSGLSATKICADMSKDHAWWDGRAFDRILLDAPCSGLGVIRRHPDIKLLRRESDILGLNQTQRQLLENLWPLLAPGGLLLYATCSVLPAENNLLLEQFLPQHSDAKIIPLSEASWGEPVSTGRQVLPRPDGMDGFYYALIQKEE